jgi:hypothetical protein
MGITDKPRRIPRYHPHMADDQPRPFANSSEHEFTLTIEEAADRYSSAGHPRTIRALQKYCARGDLECQKAETAFGQRYMITPASVARHISQIEDVSQTHGREQTRTDAPIRSQQNSQFSDTGHTEIVREQPRSDAYVQRLESENEFLRGQIGQKDKTIDALLERDRETNILVGRLQEMLTPLLGRPVGPRTGDADSRPAAN